MEEEKIDEKIRKLCVFINSLEGIRTIGCCQGHDDGGDTGNFDEPYITFICTDKRNLGLLASLECAYEDTKDWKDDYKKIQPKLRAYWKISVLQGEDSEFTPEELLEDSRNPEEYVLYCLSPDINSYEKPSDIYSDFEEILKYYKNKKKLVYGEVNKKEKKLRDLGPEIGRMRCLPKGVPEENSILHMSLIVDKRNFEEICKENECDPENTSDVSFLVGEIFSTHKKLEKLGMIMAFVDNIEYGIDYREDFYDEMV